VSDKTALHGFVIVFKDDGCHLIPFTILEDGKSHGLAEMYLTRELMIVLRDGLTQALSQGLN